MEQNAMLTLTMTVLNTIYYITEPKFQNNA